MKLTTKALWKRVRGLEKALNDASAFNQLPLAMVPAGRERHVKAPYGFIPVCYYGAGMLPLIGEIGTNGEVRYLRCKE